MTLSPLRALQGLLLGAGTLLLSSCVYDATYGGGGYYGGGGTSYGAGYSYGGYGTYNTSVFVSTSSPYWGYDPYRCLYFDYRRRCYYDPYLYGYYPRNYIPAYVYGCPHPYGWRPGYGSIRPPYRIRDYHLSSYRDRGDLYRRNNFSWARDYRERSGSGGPGRPDGRHDGDRSTWNDPRRDGNRSTWNDPRRDGNRGTWNNDPRRESTRPSPTPGWRNPGSSSNPSLITRPQPQPQTRPGSSRWTGREVPRSPQTTEPRVRPTPSQGGGRPSYTPQPRSSGEVRPTPSRQPSQPRSSGGSNRSGRSEGGSSRESRGESSRGGDYRNFR